MSPRAVTLLVAAISFYSPAAGQITLDAEDVERFLQNSRNVVVYSESDAEASEIDAIINATGPNQTYDFAAFGYSPTTSEDHVLTTLASAAGTPGEDDPAFENANFVQIADFADMTTYFYYELREDGFYSLGEIGVNDLGQWSTKFDPADRIYTFPMVYGASWDESYAQVQFPTSSEIVSTEVVEGWGTLITPSGSAPALRVKKTFTVSTSSITFTWISFITEGDLAAFIGYPDSGYFPGGATYSVATVVSNSEDEAPEHAFRLRQNYPNPFHDRTSIAFDLDKTGYVSLRVFDVTGKEVARPVSRLMPAGNHEATLSANHLPSGVYFYRLEVDGAASVRSLLVQK